MTGSAGRIIAHYEKHATACLAGDEYRSLLDDNGFDVISDARVGGRTIAVPRLC